MRKPTTSLRYVWLPLLVAFSAGCGSRDKEKASADASAVFDASAADLDSDADGDMDGDGDADSDGDGDADGDSDGDTSPTPDSAMGPGTSNEYEPGQENSNGVGTDGDDWLILDAEQFILGNLWIANSAEGTVSKVDTTLVEEVGRYHVGLAEDRADPSRTSVDLAGDVFVGNRNFNYGSPGSSSITKIAADEERCVDRDGNGTIETSTGGDDVLPRSDGSGGVPEGQSTDECVVWTRAFDDPDADPESLSSDFGCHEMRGVAATAETGETYHFNGHVWVGCFLERSVYKLNGNTGDIMQSYQLEECTPYGFLLDNQERLWISCRQGWTDSHFSPNNGVAWMDTVTGAEHFVASDPGSAQGPNPYGIALDGGGRVWITKFDGWLFRYSPDTGSPFLSDGIWDSQKVTDDFRGVAVDEDGYVWAIDTTNESVIYLIEPDLFPDPAAVLNAYYLGDDDVGGEHRARNGVGVAIDFSGHVWGVSRNGGQPNGLATRLEVDRSGVEPEVIGKDIVPVGREPYSYSDMIGYHLRHFTSREGWYRQVFEVCPEESTKWKQILFESKTPAGTSFVIRARTADRKSDLGEAEWHVVVEVPSDVSPKDLPDALPEGHFIELEVRLYTKVEDETPAVGQIGFTYECTYDVIVE